MIKYKLVIKNNEIVLQLYDSIDSSFIGEVSLGKELSFRTTDVLRNIMSDAVIKFGKIDYNFNKG